MIRLLHIADIHIGTKFAGRTETVRRALKKAVLSAFRKCVTYAIDEKLDGLIIAGDLFDSGEIPFHGESGFIGEMKRLEEAGVHVFYTTGNHDPYRDTALLKKLETFEYVHPFYRPMATTVSVVGNSGEPFKVTGAGHDGPSIKENIMATFPKKTGSDIHVGIGHTMVAAVNEKVEHGNYMPCSLVDLEDKAYDYFALGHIHKAMALDEEGRIRYSGNIQGRHYKETGPKGGYLVTIDSGITQTEFVAFHEVMWHQETVVLTEAATTLYDVGRLIKEALKKQAPEKDKWICRVYLRGTSPLTDRLQSKAVIQDLEEEMTMGLGLLDIRINTDDLSPLIDRDSLKSEPHFLGAFLERYDQTPEALKEFTTHITFLSEKGQENPEALIQETFRAIDKKLIKKIVK